MSLSTDRENWVRVPTSYDDGVLTIRHNQPPTASGSPISRLFSQWNVMPT